MSVYLITGVSNYTGASGDSKPTGVPVGSRFFEYDTGKYYRTYDGTNWTETVN